MKASPKAMTTMPEIMIYIETDLFRNITGVVSPIITSPAQYGGASILPSAFFR
jgi:hypothetical protein